MVSWQIVRRYKTFLLGLFAAAALVYGAIDILDVPAEKVWDILLYCLVGLAMVMLAALLFTAALLLVRRWLKGKDFKQD